ncbi:MAG: hypothetical protein KatS3mg110_2114 [Pirellulaceae bacterium]|nr:MAG: hypothetical protein KatS3mg110_2114 [Pirellulaceae bacterium]
MIASQVRALVADKRITVRLCDPDQEPSDAQNVDLLVIDLHTWDAPQSEALAKLVERWRRAKPGLSVWAFGPHVDTALLDAARSAGCDLVVPRSRLLSSLRKSLSDERGGDPPEPDNRRST